MKRAAVLKFGALTSYKYNVDTYNQDQLGLGPRITQRSLSSAPDDNFVGPFPVALARPMEQSTAIPVAFSWAMQWSTTKDWVFLADNATAAATRRIVMYVYDRTTQTFSWNGFITLTYPTATNHTIRGFRMTYDKYTTGTVTVSGTAVTGAGGAAWSASRIATGSRIGFGSTDPTAITTWYEIGTIGSDTSITLTASAGTVAAGTAYVIEELRAITLTSNATTTNGGLYVTKGLRAENFVSLGTTISAATTVDNIRAVYWLADASTVTNITACGVGLQDRDSWTQHYCWGLDGTTTMTLFKYNLRAALTLTAGKDTTSLALKSGTSATLTGTATQNNNGRIAQANHGPGSGTLCIYFTTGSRIYRTIAVGSITAAMTTFLADNSVEVPPGSTSTFAASGAIMSLEYMSYIDKFIVTVNSTTTPFRSYITQYRTDSGQWDRIFGVDTRQIDQTLADSTVTPHLSLSGGPFSAWVEGGVSYITIIGTTAALNRLYALPLSADWEHTTSDYVITPRIACPYIDKFSLTTASIVDVLGGANNKNLGLPTEPCRIEYRTSGISDDSGSWTLLDSSGTMSGVAGAAYIQFRVSFRTIGLTCIPARMNNIVVVYDDLSTDDHWQPSVGESDVSVPRFAWRFAVAYGSTVPALRVRLYDADTGGVLLDDNTTSPTGTWQKSTDGTTWGSYNTTDKGNTTTYIRYTPASIGSGIKVRALLTAA